ncbi:DUF4126 domain-containing protein [Waterburya agarophytonicola K14]|uniref:DUF4126 domain-containing protein n=1 Tax=Waterburya agarophytonicola KI4 TaxID=2874699 RepID=A0A964BLV3_9CYAN|nr:DUF4126 domain-containing protein [Waterburya agarophytonicola]MCC0175770.1 DUF4126 domain-containing protein [Waterburya agarophytonicola KI4]
MEIILALCLGVTLSAASGFRIFLPPLAMSLASLSGNLELSSGFGWVGTYPTAIALGIATLVEILAYYIPVVDNLLDAIEIPTAIAIGTLLTAANLGDIDPLLQWSIAAIAGGGTAGIIETFTAMTRAASTGMTGGTGNFLVSTTEALSAGILSILAIFVPIFAAALVLGLLIMAMVKLPKFIKSWQRRKRRKSR